MDDRDFLDSIAQMLLTNLLAPIEQRRLSCFIELPPHGLVCLEYLAELSSGARAVQSFGGINGVTGATIGVSVHPLEEYEVGMVR